MALPALPFALPWKWIAVAVAALIVVAAVIFSILSYGNARFDAGVLETDAKWEAAAEELKRQSNAAAAAADEPADERAVDYAERLTEEKEKLDEAEDAGTDPFDIMFDTVGL